MNRKMRRKYKKVAKAVDDMEDVSDWVAADE